MSNFSARCWGYGKGWLLLRLAESWKKPNTESSMVDLTTLLRQTWVEIPASGIELELKY